MASAKSETDSISSDIDEESEFLDPRIQIELERLNTCTDEINRLETELDEANTTFRMLLNESMRRLKVLTCKLGSCIDRARPYYEAVDIAKKAQAECQRAAVKFQRANEIHQAAKETVALAEARFLSNQHEWQFDSAWQEMLNHAIIKVTEAEHQRAESGQEHQKRATLFNVAEQRVAMLEQKLKRTILKSRPYFEEKALCQEQLDTQKKRVEELQGMISKVKSDYAGSLKRLEAISEEIHQRRRIKSGCGSPVPRGPREPGVGAELDPKQHEELHLHQPHPIRQSFSPEVSKCRWSGEDLENELEKYDVCSLGSLSIHTSSHVSESEDYDDDDLDELREKVKELSMAEVRSDTWETELAQSILRLDNAMLQRECNRELRAIASKPCGSPIREQDCNRELTAIASRNGNCSCNVAEQVCPGNAENPSQHESDSVTSSPMKSSDSLVSVKLNDSCYTANDVSNDRCNVGVKKILDSLGDVRESIENRPDGGSDTELPSCSKSLDAVLAEEESKRFISLPAVSLCKESGVLNRIEVLSAVALNKMINDKESLSGTGMSLKTVSDPVKADSGLEPISSDFVDSSQWILPGLEPRMESNDSQVETCMTSERRQSIGAAALELLNSTKIETIRANLNENILHTIKDVSESVLNRLVRQDSKTEQNSSGSSWHSNLISNIPFKNNDSNGANDDKNCDGNSMVQGLDDSVVELKPNDSATFG